MEQTVIGIFEKTTQAEDAKAYLIANGFDSDHIEIHSIAGSNYGTLPIAEDESIGDRISRFFSNLFDNEEDARAHAEAAGRATTLVVHTVDEDQTRQAIQVLDNFGAVDVDNFLPGTPHLDANTFGSTSAEDQILESAVEVNAPLDTDLINTDILNTHILDNPSSASGSATSETNLGSGAVGRRSRVVNRPETNREGLGSNINDF